MKIKDDKVRMEMDLPEGKVITIIDGDTIYSYSPSEKSALKLINKNSLDTKVLCDYGAHLKSLGAKIIGFEKLEKYDCDIYEFTDPRFDMSSKVWLWKEKEFPVKVETKVPDGVMTSTMTEVEIGIDIDDSEFILPEGIKILNVE